MVVRGCEHRVYLLWHLDWKWPNVCPTQFLDPMADYLAVISHLGAVFLFHYSYFIIPVKWNSISRVLCMYNLISEISSSRKSSEKRYSVPNQKMVNFTCTLLQPYRMWLENVEYVCGIVVCVSVCVFLVRKPPNLGNMQSWRITDRGDHLRNES